MTCLLRAAITNKLLSSRHQHCLHLIHTTMKFQLGAINFQETYNITILQNKTNTNPICVQFAGSHIDLLYCVLCSMVFICQVSKYISSSPACQKWNIDQISFWRQTPSNVFQACANFSSDFLRRYRWRDARHPPSLLRFDECAACQLAGGPRGAAARAGDTQ